MTWLYANLFAGMAAALCTTLATCSAYGAPCDSQNPQETVPAYFNPSDSVPAIFCSLCPHPSTTLSPTKPMQTAR